MRYYQKSMASTQNAEGWKQKDEKYNEKLATLRSQLIRKQHPPPTEGGGGRGGGGRGGESSPSIPQPVLLEFDEEKNQEKNQEIKEAEAHAFTLFDSWRVSTDAKNEAIRESDRIIDKMVSTMTKQFEHFKNVFNTKLSDIEKFVIKYQYCPLDMNIGLLNATPNQHLYIRFQWKLCYYAREFHRGVENYTPEPTSFKFETSFDQSKNISYDPKQECVRVFRECAKKKRLLKTPDFTTIEDTPQSLLTTSDHRQRVMHTL